MAKTEVKGSVKKSGGPVIFDADSVYSADEDLSEALYDENPYVSLPFPQTRPELIRALINRKYGAVAPAIDKARVLEIGCSHGFVLLPLAEQYPDAHFVGVDISKKHIDYGKKIAELAGYKNVDLRHMSISDFPKDEKYDYIISHGVYSWVPENVRNDILRVMHDNLTPNGLVYLSANMYPGWDMKNVVKEFMLFHAHGMELSQEVVSRSLAALKVVSDAMQKEYGKGNNYYVDMFAAEAGAIQDKKAYYLLHEHFSQINEPKLLHQLVAEFAEHNLHFITDIKGMRDRISVNLSPQTTELMDSIQDNVKREQYLDFIGRSTFSSMILCRSDTKMFAPENRGDLINEFLMYTHVTHKIDGEGDNSKGFVNFNDESQVISYTFSQTDSSSAESITFNTSDPILKAVSHGIMENGFVPFKFSDIVGFVKKYGVKIKDINDVHQKCAGLINKLISFNVLIVTFSNIAYYGQVPSKPKVFGLARVKASQIKPEDIGVSDSAWVPNTISMVYALHYAQLIVARTADGTRTVQEIADEVYKAYNKGEVTFSDLIMVTNEDQLKRYVLTFVHNTLTLFRKISLLVR